MNRRKNGVRNRWRRLRKAVRIAVALAAALGTASAARAGEPDSCAKCHEKEAASETEGVHRHAGFSCASCHGGNPAAETREAAHQDSFRGQISRADVPTLCAKCHADVRMMNPYGLPTDQYAQYLSSKHGEALAKGATDVATCVDCHNTHGIRKVRDPQSPIHPKNVPGTCGRCHSDTALMKKHGLKTDEEKLYRESVHAEMLLEKDDLSAPMCTTCHGNHGAVPPGFKEVAHVCGKCHVKQQDFFLESAHGKATAAGDFQGCMTCHSNHKILRTPEKIFKHCGLCHDEDTPAMRKRDAIFSLIVGAKNRYAATKDRLDAMTRAGFHTEDEAVQLEEARTILMQLSPVQHTLNLEKVDTLAKAQGAVLGEITAALDGKEEANRWKKRSMVPIWIFLVGMAVLFAVKQRRMEKPQE